jgi:quinol-cytochrome oxidoreductase complex cytochrome b subunit
MGLCIDIRLHPHQMAAIVWVGLFFHTGNIYTPNNFFYKRSEENGRRSYPWYFTLFYHYVRSYGVL